MNYERLTQDLKQVHRLNQRMGLWLGLLTIGHLLALGIILGLIGRERTIVVPPKLEKSFWVSGDAVSHEYLEQMGAFIAWLILDVSPSSIQWKTETLLGYVEADQYATLKSQQELETGRLRKLNASTSFLPLQLVASEEKQQVVIRGRLRTQVNALETSNLAKAYRIQFHYAGGRIQLRSFQEVPYAPTPP